MSNPSNLTYENINNPYNKNMERAGDGLIDDVEGSVGMEAITGGGLPEAKATEGPGETEIISGQALGDLWISNWIKSRSYQPKSQGFYLNAKEGYIEANKLYIGSGGIIGGKLDIPDETTANSFHVDSTGNIWSGANVANKATAPFKVTEAGVLTTTSGKIGNWNINSTSIYTGTEDHSGYTANVGDITIYSDGSNASIHAKNFYIDTAGSITATSATITGSITGSTITSTTITGGTIQTNVATYPNVKITSSGVTVAGTSTLNFIATDGSSSGYIGGQSGTGADYDMSLYNFYGKVLTYGRYGIEILAGSAGAAIDITGPGITIDAKGPLGNDQIDVEGDINLASGYEYKINGSAIGGGTVTSIETTGAITGGTITTTGTIAHSTSSGYKHVPTSGASQKFLKYSSSGTAVWSYLSASANAGTIVPTSGTANLGNTTYYWDNVYVGKVNCKPSATNPSSAGDIRSYASGAIDQFRGRPGDGTWLGSFDMTAA